MTAEQTDTQDIEVDAGPVDAAWARVIAAGVRVVVKAWGQRVGHPFDLNGVLVEIGTPRDDQADPPAQVGG